MFIYIYVYIYIYDDEGRDRKLIYTARKRESTEVDIMSD